MWGMVHPVSTPFRADEKEFIMRVDVTLVLCCLMCVSLELSSSFMDNCRKNLEKSLSVPVSGRET